MNKNIKLLAEQADEFADNEIQMQGEYHPDWHNIRDQKFAELIVRACADVACQHYPEYGNFTACDAIKEFFGVEE